MGYTVQSACVDLNELPPPVRERLGLQNLPLTSGMGIHAYKPGTLDDKLDPMNPEIMLIFLVDGQLKVVGVEYEAVAETQNAKVLEQPMQLFPQGHGGMEGIAHYVQHVYFAGDQAYQFGLFNPGLRCTPLPATDKATATIKNASGTVVGTATLEETAAGVLVTVEGKNLSPGLHGTHIHAVGKCEAPEFASAGGHFNPANKKHGVFYNPDGPHAGDLPNLNVLPNGTGHLTVLNDRMTLKAGQNGLFDADGSAIIIHADKDDFKTDPTGNSGGRMACGVIERAAR